ncbi:MAG: TIR domain-containing protein [Chloroflexi bacterium]|nr:TIR domain-containing protein [Chloroflexota bacterium]
MRENDSYFDIFFIYHPADLERVRRIVAQLRATGVDACFNEDEFGKSADGSTRLKDGALRSYSVAFVMSPDSAESQLCNELLQYAVSHGKRLVTLILQEEIEVEVHPAIAQNPYVFFREEDDLGARVDELRAYLRADANLKLHTELLVLAEKWRGRGRPPDLLLPHDRLDEARSWLATASARHPKPSALQLEYIHSSRRQPPRRARHRPRRIVLGILLIVALGAGLLLLLQAVNGWQSGRAVVALTSEAAARAGLAAAKATAESDSAVGLIDQVAATGAGVRAAVAEFATAESITATAAAKLTQTAQALEQIRATRTRATEIAQLERDEVAAGLVQAGEDALARGEIELALALAWQAKDGLEHPRSAYRLLRKASAAGRTMTLNDVALIRLHPAGDGFAVAPRGGDKLQFYDGETWSLVHEWTDQNGRIGLIAYSRDGESMASASDDGEVVIRDGLSGSVAQRLRAHEGAVTAIALSPAGDTLYSAGSDPLLAAWDVESGEELATYRADTSGEMTLYDLIVTGDGERVIGWSEADGSIKMAQWSAETLELITADSDGRAHRGYDDSGNIGYSGGSSLPAYPGDSNTGDLLLWELSTSRQLARVTEGFNWSFLSGDRLAAATDDLLFISFYEEIALVVVDNSESDRRAALIDARDGSLLRRYDSEVSKMLKSAQFLDSETILSATVDNRAVLWSSADGSFIREIASAPASIESLQASADSGLVIAKTADGAAHLWRLSDRAAEPLLTISDSLPGASISPSGDVFLHVQEGAVSLQQVDNQALLLQLPASTVSMSGERLAVYSDDRLIVIDIETGAEVRSWQWDGGAVSDLHLSPDGESALAFTEANELWLARGDLDSAQRLADEAARPRLVRFAPAGEWIMTLQGDYALLWELENGAARGAYPLGVSSGTAVQAAFSDAGDRIYFFVQLAEGLAGLTAIDVRDNVASRLTFVGVEAAALSTDGQHLTLAFSGGRIRVISTDSGEVLHEFHSGASDLRQLRYLPRTDTVIAIAGSALNLWDAAAGVVDRRFAHPKPLVDFSHSRNGERILTRDESGMARIWQVESAEALLARIAAENEPRELTCGERERYLVAPLCA